MRDNIEHEEGATPSEVVSRGGGGGALWPQGYWSFLVQNNERERSDERWGGGGECTRAFPQDPPQLNFLDVVF